MKPKTITLNITQALIDEATQKKSTTCMIAQAIRHAGGRSTHVTAENVSFNLGDSRFTYPLPARAAVELRKFDRDKKSVRPFRFALDGRSAFSRPVIKRPHATKRGPTKHRRHKRGPRRSERRYHGLRVIEVAH